MGELVLIDTSAWISFFARKGFPEMKQAISGLLDDDMAAIAGPIMVELVQGARSDNEKAEINDRIRGVYWLQITDDHWHKAAELSFSLRRKGITVSAIDSILAATAIAYDCRILHKDSDFELIAGHSSLMTFCL